MKKSLLILIAITTNCFSNPVSVNDSINNFQQVVTENGNILTDFVGDQQTGQSQDDFTVNGFYINYGDLSSGDYAVLYRFRLSEYNKKGEYSGNIRIGIDANTDGSVDLFYGITASGSPNQQGIVFQNPTNIGPEFNVSPDTSSLSSIYGVIPFSSLNYSYENTNDGTNEAYLTFAVTFNSIQNALNDLGFSLSQESYVRYIAFTSTQINAINQDLYGVDGINSVRFDSGGGFTRISNFYGYPIPEPSSYGLIFMFILLLVYFSYQKHKNAR